MTTTWSEVLRLPELVELRRRRRVLTATLGAVAALLFAGFLVGFAAFPEELGETRPFDVPLSLWIVFFQFAGTWVLVWAYFRFSRTYVGPAVDAAVDALTDHRTDSTRITALTSELGGPRS
ncbi:DUF485 domain-containing protein [Rhodococcus sp. NPDC003994]